MGHITRTPLNVSDALYWNLLGIDVWVRSGGNFPISSDLSNKRSSEIRQQSSNLVRPDQINTLAQEHDVESAGLDRSVSALLQCLSLDNVFVVMSGDAWASRKLILDIARSINLYRGQTRKDFTFQWPQIEYANNTFDSMVRAFETFLRSQNAINGVLISAGEMANTIARVQTVSSKILVISQIPKSGKEKRILWEQIEKL